MNSPKKFWRYDNVMVVFDHIAYVY